MKLSIELLPSTAWGTSLSKKLPRSRWDKIRKHVYNKEKYCCHICGEKCKSLDAHEIWSFDKLTHVQKLENVIGVCKSCHNAIHYGRAQKIGYAEEAKKQFMKVNKCGSLRFNQEVLRAQRVYQSLSVIRDWSIDLSYLNQLESETD